MPPDPGAAGPLAVQVVRTYPAKRPPFPFAPQGERSVARAYLKALRRARSLIYLEDQYLWSDEVSGVLAAALERSAGAAPDRGGTALPRLGREAVGACPTGSASRLP